MRAGHAALNSDMKTGFPAAEKRTNDHFAQLAVRQRELVAEQKAHGARMRTLQIQMARLEGLREASPASAPPGGLTALRVAVPRRPD